MQTPSKSKPAAPATTHPSALILQRNQIAYALFRGLLALTGINLAGVLMAFVALMLAWGHTPAPEYIPLNATGQLLPSLPVSKPVPDSRVVAFALRAIRAVNTYDYVSWRDQINAAAPLFAPDAWNNYLKTLSHAGTLQAVVARRMVVSVTMTGAPDILQAGHTPNGAYAWRVRIPVDIHYDANDINAMGERGRGNDQRGDVILVIERVPFGVDAQGLAIEIYQLVGAATPVP